jgi:ATP-dependent Clp protease ATP-binding subunit ClpC
MVTAERMTRTLIRARLQALVEASSSGRYRVEPQHLLLGLLREAKPLFDLCSLDTEAVKNDVQKTFPRITNRQRVDIPEESPETVRVLGYAAEEAKHMGFLHIGSGHLLLGLLREENAPGAAAILQGRGLQLPAVRRLLANDRGIEE